MISLLFSSTIPSGSSVVPLSLQVPPIILSPKSAQWPLQEKSSPDSVYEPPSPNVEVNSLLALSEKVIDLPETKESLIVSIKELPLSLPST